MTEERNAYTAVREENGGNLPAADIRAAEKERAGPVRCGLPSLPIFGLYLVYHR